MPALGPITYDLVSLLHDTYVELSSHSIQKLLNYYKDQAHSLYKDKPPGDDEFEHDFQLQILQRCFKACGSFSSFYNLRDDRRYLKYIKKTLRQIIHVLEDFPEYSAFKKCLTETGALERNFQDL